MISMIVRCPFLCTTHRCQNMALHTGNMTSGPMAHLASFGRSPAIKAPYVCQQMFHGSIFDYPERRGWDKEKLYLGDFEGRTLEETRGFLQEWLYFGPLVHILDIPGMSFNPRDFIYHEDGKQWITTKKLPEYMKRWYFQPEFGHMGGRSLQQRQETFQQALSGLQTIHRYVLRYCGKDSNRGIFYPPTTFWPLSPELSLSIIALTDSLTKAGFEATNMSFNLHWGVSGFLVDRMVDSGWCPNLISTLTTAQQIHLHYSAYTLGAPDRRNNHGNCDELVCKVDQIDEKTYKTEHTIENCKCDFKGPLISEVVEILKNGDVPLVECYESGDNFEVRVVEQTATSPSRSYVAISHVCKTPCQRGTPIIMGFSLLKPPWLQANAFLLSYFYFESHH